jgi:hypothetical protein
MPSLDTTLPITLTAPDGTQTDAELSVEASADWLQTVDIEPYGMGHAPRTTWSLENVWVSLRVGGKYLRDYVKEGYVFQAGDDALDTVTKVRHWVEERLSEKD